MGTLFDPRDRAAILDRIARLSEDRRPLWGRFTAPEMVCHVSTGLRNGLNEVDLGPSVPPLNRWPLNWLVIHVVPWPKGAKAPPEMLATKATTWATDVIALRDLVERFGARGPGGTWPESKVFGRISGRSWGVLQHKHLDHHLRQFGV
jgi:hypothetical protein